MSTKCSQQVTTWLGMFKSWPQMIPKRNQPNNLASLTFHYKNPRKKNVLPKTHIYHIHMPEPRLKVGFAMAKQKWTEKNMENNPNSAPSDNRARNFKNAKVSPTRASSSALINGKSWLRSRLAMLSMLLLHLSNSSTILDGILCWCSYDNVTVQCRNDLEIMNVHL